jgi:hypothetical protein
MTAMTIDTIKQTDLTVSERQVLDDDRERWRRMGSGAHLDDWLAYGPGLLIPPKAGCCCRKKLEVRWLPSESPCG